MTKLSHTQAQEYIERRANAVGHEPWLAAVEAHLAHCPECRAYARRHAWLEHWLRQARPRRSSPRLALERVQMMYERWAWHMTWLRVMLAAQRFAPALSLVLTLFLAGWWLAQMPTNGHLVDTPAQVYAHTIIPNVPEFELHDEGAMIVASANEGDTARANYR